MNRSNALFVAGLCSISTGLVAIGYGAQNDHGRAVIPAAVATEKSVFVMTAEERRAAHLARDEAARAPLHDRARWACSSFIASALHVPTSARWVRRSTWPAAIDGGEWFVQASYTARNRLNVETQHTSICQMRYAADRDEWDLVRVSTART